MNQNKITVQIDPKGFNSKPDRNEFPSFKKRLAENTDNIELDVFCGLVGNQGHGFARAIFDGEIKQESFDRQQMFGIDIDEGLSFEAFMERSQLYGLFPFLVYKTFSADDMHEKYRAIYLCDHVIQDVRVAKFMNYLLIKIFPESDKACKDAARVFWGGKEIIYKCLENRIGIMQTMMTFYAFEKETNEKKLTQTIRDIATYAKIQLEGKRFCVYEKDKTEKEPPESYMCSCRRTPTQTMMKT